MNNYNVTLNDGNTLNINAHEADVEGRFITFNILDDGESAYKYRKQ